MFNLKNLKYIFLCLLIVSGLYFAILLVYSFNNKPDIKDIGVIKFDDIISKQSLTSSQELILDNQNDEDFSYKLNYKPKKPPTIKEMKKFLDID